MRPLGNMPAVQSHQSYGAPISTITGNPVQSSRERFLQTQQAFVKMGEMFNMLSREAAYMAPGSGEYLSAQDARSKGVEAERALAQGDVMTAIGKYAEALPDVIGAIPVVGAAIRTSKRIGKTASKWATGVPVNFDFIHNTQKSPYIGERFGQHKEPSGRYIQEKPSTFKPMENMEAGSVTFKNPLVIDFGGGYTEQTNWKNVLSDQYGGKTGRQLSEAIKKDGYDGIVTWDEKWDVPSEIVDLTSPATLPDIESKAKGVGVKLDIFESKRKPVISLSRIEVPKQNRNTGIGSETMQEIANYADATGKTVELSPSSDFGGSPPRLKKFYKRFGFVENKGRNKDYEISESMYRLPR